jgi:hypothetical protein
MFFMIVHGSLLLMVLLFTACTVKNIMWCSFEVVELLKETVYVVSSSTTVLNP